MGDVRVGRYLTIPDSELKLRFTTSGGPGGQHANKSSTRVELLWNLEDSQAVGPRQRARIKQKLRNRIDAGGNLKVTVDTHRSQYRNREEAEARLADLVSAALRTSRRRVATKPTRSSKEQRLRAKKRRSEIKKLRGRDYD